MQQTTSNTTADNTTVKWFEQLNKSTVPRFIRTPNKLLTQCYKSRSTYNDRSHNGHVT